MRTVTHPFYFVYTERETSVYKVKRVFCMTGGAKHENRRFEVPEDGCGLTEENF